MVDGLNKGIAARGDDNDKPPAYYAESGPPIRILKAIGLAVAAVAPYVTVLDTLGSVKGDVFIPCNNFTCHYIQLFRADIMPGTGVGMLSVQNGVSDAVSFSYKPGDPSKFFTAFTCPRIGQKSNKTRTFQERLSGGPCPRIGVKEYHSFLGSLSETRHLVENENERAAQASFFVRVAFIITKFPMWLYTLPLTIISKHSDLWGMEHIPTGQCPHRSPEEMREICNTPDVKRKIHNHMKAYSPTKILLVAGLAGCALFSAMHDIALLRGWSEMVSLPLGAVAAAMQGAAVVGVFLWSMGATEVFVSKIMSKHNEVECVCFYQLPELTQLVALSTPFALLMAFYARVQLCGMAALFGDHLYFLRFDVPYYLAKQSFLWTWGVLMTPKAAGTIKAEKRWADGENLDSNYWYLCAIQQALMHFRNAVMLCVGLAAGPFMVSSKELLYSMLLPDHDLTPLMRSLILYVALPLPAIIAGLMGVFAVYEVANMCVWHDVGEDFPYELNALLPSCIFNTSMETSMRKWDKFNIAGKLCFALCAPAVVLLTAATVYGLMPDLTLILGWHEAHHASLVQAELWGACGFMFMVLHVQRLFSGFVFSTWDDVESLIKLKKDPLPKNHRSLMGAE